MRIATEATQVRACLTFSLSICAAVLLCTLYSVPKPASSAAVPVAATEPLHMLRKAVLKKGNQCTPPQCLLI